MTPFPEVGTLKKVRPAAIAVGVLAALALWIILDRPSQGRQDDSVVAPEVLEALQADETTRVIVALEDPLPPTADLAERKQRGQEAINRALDALSSDEFQLTEEYEAFFAFAAEITAQALNALEGLPEVVRIHPDIEFRIPDPGGVAGAGVAAQLAESVPLINADQVHGEGVDGGAVRIAVLDTGVDTDHPDFGTDTTGDRIVAQNCFLDNVSGSCPSSGDVAEDDNGHGTNVTGTAASDGSDSATGVAPAAEIVAVKVLNSDGTGSFSDVLSALEWIQDNNDTLNVSVINMSFGGGPIVPPCDSDFPSMDSAIEQLRASGVISFAASGNDNEPTKVAPPACISDAVSVGAVYDDDLGSVAYSVCEDTSTEPDKVACFTNGAPDLQAPGAAMTASGMDGGTSTFFGTSQASPAAAGVALLLLEADGSLSPDEIESTLKDTGVLVTDPKNDESRPRVDAKAAFDAVSTSSDTSAVFRVENDGDVYADGAYYCGLSSGCFNAGTGADIAERIDTSEPVEPGDLIAIDPNRDVTYRKSRKAYSELVVGVVSTAPAITLGNTAAELRALMSRPVIKPNRSAWVGRLVNNDFQAAWSSVGATGRSPLRSDVNVGADLCVCPDVGTLSSFHGAHTQMRPYNGESVGTKTVGAGPRACPDETACASEGQPQGVAPTWGSVGIVAGVQWASTVAVLVDHDRTDRLWNRLPGRPLMALMGRVPVKATTENGFITPGDLLVSSSTPGHVMRCADPQRCQGALIGKALEPLRSGRGTIEMLLMP